MPIRVDPEGNEIGALFDLVELGGKQVLEVGSGDGRLTWRYADKAAHVTGVEPFAPSVEKAQQNIPHELKGRIQFHTMLFAEFAAVARPGIHDVAILAWSLCWMQPEGMVHALEEIHRLLKPGGVLVDIHPVVEPMTIEVYQGGKVVFAQPGPDTFTESYRQADSALAQVVQRGLYAMERQANFDFLVYGSTAAELRDFLAEANAYEESAKGEEEIAQEAEIFAMVEGVLQRAGADAEVATHERALITRMRLTERM